MAPVTEAVQALAAQIVRPVADQLAQDIMEQLALAVNAGVAQLTAGVRQQVRPSTAVAAGGAAMPTIRIVAVGDVATATEPNL